MDDHQSKAAAESRLALWVRKAMEIRGILTVRQLAEYSGVAASAISLLLRGKTKPRLETVDKLAAYFRVDRNYLLDLLATKGYTADTIPRSIFLDEATGVLLIPVVEQEAGAGGGVGVLDFEYIAPTLAAGHRNLIAVRVRGDCMVPKIDDGDTVIVDREADWANGRVVLARVDDRILVKRAYREDGRVRLKTDNPKYQDIIEPDTAVLGVVIRVIKEV